MIRLFLSEYKTDLSSCIMKKILSVSLCVNKRIFTTYRIKSCTALLYNILYKNAIKFMPHIPNKLKLSAHAQTHDPSIYDIYTATQSLIHMSKSAFA